MMKFDLNLRSICFSRNENTEKIFFRDERELIFKSKIICSNLNKKIKPKVILDDIFISMGFDGYNHYKLEKKSKSEIKFFNELKITEKRSICNKINSRIKNIYGVDFFSYHEAEMFFEKISPLNTYEYCSITPPMNTKGYYPSIINEMDEINMISLEASLIGQLGETVYQSRDTFYFWLWLGLSRKLKPKLKKEFKEYDWKNKDKISKYIRVFILFVFNKYIEEFGSLDIDRDFINLRIKDRTLWMAMRSINSRHVYIESLYLNLYFNNFLKNKKDKNIDIIEISKKLKEEIEKSKDINLNEKRISEDMHEITKESLKINSRNAYLGKIQVNGKTKRSNPLEMELKRDYSIVSLGESEEEKSSIGLNFLHAFLECGWSSSSKYVDDQIVILRKRPVSGGIIILNSIKSAFKINEMLKRGNRDGKVIYISDVKENGMKEISNINFELKNKVKLYSNSDFLDIEDIIRNDYVLCAIESNEEKFASEIYDNYFYNLNKLIEKEKKEECTEKRRKKPFVYIENVLVDFDKIIEGREKLKKEDGLNSIVSFVSFERAKDLLTSGMEKARKYVEMADLKINLNIFIDKFTIENLFEIETTPGMENELYPLTAYALNNEKEMPLTFRVTYFKPDFVFKNEEINDLNFSRFLDISKF